MDLISAEELKQKQDAVDAEVEAMVGYARAKVPSLFSLLLPGVLWGVGSSVFGTIARTSCES